jgi:uncharacterized protein (TIGR01777 family)
MKKTIALTGATGFIGSALKEALQKEGHTVLSLSRTHKNDSLTWWPSTPEGTLKELQHVTHFIHLAGDGIAKRPWTKKRKKTLLKNRKDLAVHISGLCAGMPKLEHLMVGSAIGFYGTSGEPHCTEDTTAGSDFSAALCQAIENHSKAPSSVKVSFLRTSPVLAKHGGVLKQMLPSFLIGLGGKMGTGQQPFAWISLNDEVRAIQHIMDKKIEGSVNLAAPAQDTQMSFAKALGKALKRPTLFITPAFVLRFVLKDMADELLLGGRTIIPEKLTKSGFSFKHPTLAQAFNDIFK